MLSINEENQIIFSKDDIEWNLEKSEDYKRFLLWITSPNEEENIDVELFDIDSAVDEGKKPRAMRYKEFLKAFAERRIDIINKHKEAGIDYKSQLDSMQTFIDSLSVDANE